MEDIVKRRELFSTTGASALALVMGGCTQAQLDEAQRKLVALRNAILARMKSVSAKVNKAAQDLAGKFSLPQVQDLATKIKDNDTKIQQATKLAPVLEVYASAGLGLVRELVKVGQLIPGAGPYVATLNEAMDLLDAVIKDAEAA